MTATESHQFSNISATTGAFTLMGGKYGLDISATWGGGNAIGTMKRLLFAAALIIFGLGTAHAQQQQTGNLVSGSGNATGTSATQIIAAPTATRRLYVTAAQCGRTDAGTTAIHVTLNDTSSTVIVIPNLGGGGGNNPAFTSPLTVAAATALTFTASSGVSTVFCNAQGFTGN